MCILVTHKSKTIITGAHSGRNPGFTRKWVQEIKDKFYIRRKTPTSLYASASRMAPVIGGFKEFEDRRLAQEELRWQQESMQAKILKEAQANLSELRERGHEHWPAHL